MDSMAVNKTMAAVLTAGIAYMGASILSGVLVRPVHLAQTAIKIEGVPEATPVAAAAPAASAQAAAGGPPPAGGATPASFETAMASSDPAAGESTTKKLCVSCHSFGEGGKALVGPNLYGVVGAPHGHMEGYAYSAALKGKDGPWTMAELNEWLRKPAAYAPGTKMGFAGIADDQTRANVINYLHTLSHSPEPMPTATPASAPVAVAAPPAAKEQTGNPEAGNGGAAAASTQSTPAVGAANQTQPAPTEGGSAK